MVAITGAPIVDNPSSHSSVVADAAVDASIARYLASGERVSSLMDVGTKVCLAVVGLLILAWVFGALPIAVKLF